MAMPRVNSAMLPEYKNKTVRITGKVLNLDGENATLDCSDQGQVIVKLNRDSNFADEYVEVIARVTGDNTVQELTSMNMGNTLDMGMVEAVVRRSHQFSSIFHAESSGGDGGYGY